MASASDVTNREAAMRKQKKGPPFKFLVPLIYAPILPLIRIGLRTKPVLRDRLFIGVLAGAFLHGSYLVYPFSHLSMSSIFPIQNALRTDLYDVESKDHAGSV